MIIKKLKGAEKVVGSNLWVNISESGHTLQRRFSCETNTNTNTNTQIIIKDTQITSSTWLLIQQLYDINTKVRTVSHKYKRTTSLREFSKGFVNNSLCRSASAETDFICLCFAEPASVKQPAMLIFRLRRHTENNPMTVSYDNLLRLAAVCCTQCYVSVTTTMRILLKRKRDLCKQQWFLKSIYVLITNSSNGFKIKSKRNHLSPFQLLRLE